MLRAFTVLLILSAAAYSQQTVAEKTNYKATSRHADVLAFCDELVKNRRSFAGSTSAKAARDGCCQCSSWPIRRSQRPRKPPRAAKRS